MNKTECKSINHNTIYSIVYYHSEKGKFQGVIWCSVITSLKIKFSILSPC